MLDTHGRKYMQPLIKYLADICIKLGFSANGITVIAFLLGVCASILIYIEFTVLGIIILWISGLLDAVDGTIAREKGSSLFGALMDITFDRIVEIGLILVLAIKYPNHIFILLLLTSSIIISMTIFLTVGSLSTKISEKSFYYQAGLAERTEGFIFFSSMVLFPQYLGMITMIFTILILFTAGQRMYEASKILK
jgi:phosphatidylglycerophosphate synthase